jgi:hypothetical protein
MSFVISGLRPETISACNTKEARFVNQSSTWHRCSHFTGFSSVVMILVVGDVFIDSEMLVVTSSISRCADLVFQKCS